MGGKRPWGQKTLGAKDLGGKRPWGQKTLGAKDQGEKDQGEKVLEPNLFGILRLMDFTVFKCLISGCLPRFVVQCT